MAVVESTLRALVAPRRLLPIVLVAAVLVLVQAAYSPDARAALVPLAMATGFVLLGPASWRAWVAAGARRAPRPLGLAAYAAGALAVVGVAGVLLPRALHLGPTFLGDPGSLAVATVLYLAGGWGLGRDVELELDLAHAQLVGVRTHLDPHFLYNTLNAIAEWCREDAAQAEEAILRLSAMLEAIFTGLETRVWPLERELALAADLVALHRVRDPGALALETRVDAGLAAATHLPPLSLLLLVENAIKHGLRRGHAGVIGIEVVAAGAGVRASVENPGPYRPGAPGRGLALLGQRLRAAYGGGARVVLEDLGGATRATLHLPGRAPR